MKIIPAAKLSPELAMLNTRRDETTRKWQAEPYDHVIRDAADFAHAVRYVWENPTKAGLRDWPWVWASEEVRLVADLED